MCFVVTLLWRQYTKCFVIIFVTIQNVFRSYLTLVIIHDVFRKQCVETVMYNVYIYQAMIMISQYPTQNQTNLAPSFVFLQYHRCLLMSSIAWLSVHQINYHYH